MVVTLLLGQQYNTGEKPTVMLYTYINRHVGTPDKNKANIFLVHMCVCVFSVQQTTYWNTTTYITMRSDLSLSNNALHFP